MTNPFPFTRLTPEEAMAQYPALFATFKAEFSWSGLSLSGNYDKMIAAMVSIAVARCGSCGNPIILHEWWCKGDKTR